MKKVLLLLVLVLLCISNCIKNPSGPGSIKPDAWYLDKQGPVPLYYSREKIVVKLNTDIKQFYRTYPYFDPAKKPEPAPYGFYLIFLAPETNVKWLLSLLDKDPRVEIVNPVFIDEDSLECIPNDRVIVKFKSYLSRLIIDSLNALNQVALVDAIIPDSNMYVLKVTKQTGKTVLEITNIYEQSEYTDFAIYSCWIEIGPTFGLR